MVRPVVDLPQPDSPTSPKVSPVMTSKLTPSTARTWPTVRWMTPRRMGKCLTRPSTFNRTLPLGEVEVRGATRAAVWVIAAAFPCSRPPGRRPPAGNPVLRGNAHQGRILLPTTVLDESATDGERAILRFFQQDGGHAVDR